MTRTRPSGRLRLPVLALMFAAAVVLVAGRAHAADVFVEPLAAAGLPDDAQPAFQATLAQAFEKTGHKLVSASGAAFRARATITKDRSHYELTVRVSNGLGKKLTEKTAECAPCTLDQAQKQLELLVRTVSLDLGAIEEAVPPGPPPVPASSLPPVRTAPPAAVVPPLHLQTSRPPAPREYEFTGWYQAMRWTSILPSVAGVLSAIQMSDRAKDEARCRGPAPDCPKDPAILGGSIAAMLVAESFTVLSALDLMLARPGPQGSNVARLLPWLGFATSGILGVTGYLFIKNDGYGSEWNKKLGYANLPLAALAATTSLGALIAGPVAPSPGSTTALVGPGFAGVRVRF